MARDFRHRQAASSTARAPTETRKPPRSRIWKPSGRSSAPWLAIVYLGYHEHALGHSDIVGQGWVARARVERRERPSPRRI